MREEGRDCTRWKIGKLVSKFFQKIISDKEDQTSPEGYLKQNWSRLVQERISDRNETDQSRRIRSKTDHSRRRYQSEVDHISRTDQSLLDITSKSRSNQFRKRSQIDNGKTDQSRGNRSRSNQSSKRFQTAGNWSIQKEISSWSRSDQSKKRFRKEVEHINHVGHLKLK